MTNELIGTYEPWQSLPEAQERIAELERENAELRKAYEPVERSFRVVWAACAFGYEGTPVGEAFNHIKAWFDGVRL